MAEDFVVDSEALLLSSSCQAYYQTFSSLQGRSQSTIYNLFPIPKDSKFIRLLHLERADKIEDDLVGHFQLVSLENGAYPQFHALSYTWGILQQDIIKCGTAEVSITRNCRDALRQIRHYYGKITIWVDSICIDQKNEEEKLHQISLMGEVYKKAHMVDIWLGPETRALRQAMNIFTLCANLGVLPLDKQPANPHGRFWQKMKLLISVCTPFFVFTWLYSMFKCLPMEPLTIRKIILEDYWRVLSPDWNVDWPEQITSDLIEFFNQPWFLRAWTFQEIVLARDARIFCGSATLRWATFVRGFGYIHARLRSQSDFDSHPVMLPRYPTFGRGRICYDRINARNFSVYQEDFSERTNEDLRTRFNIFDLVIRIWMLIDKPVLGTNKHKKIDTQASIYTQQKPYYDICNLFLPSFQFQALIIWFFPPWSSPFLFFYFLGMEFNPIIWVCFFVHSFFLPFAFGLAGYFFHLIPLLDTGYIIHMDKDPSNVQLDGIIQTLRQRSASNPKDMSYALYGVLSAMLSTQLSEPDYQKSQGHIYHELLLYLLAWQPEAMVLLQDAGMSLDGNTDKNNIPSWVPDWSKNSPKPTISAKYFSCHPIYSASSNERPFIRIIGNHELSVEGHWKDEISFCVDKFERIYDHSNQTYNTATISALIQPVTTFSWWIETLRSNTRPFIPLADREGDDMTRVPDASLAWDMYLLVNQKSSCEEKTPDLIRMETVYNIFTKANTASGQHPSVEAVLNIVQILQKKHVFGFFIDTINDMACNDRRLFITSTGYIGCGSKGLVVGDRLALIAGMHAPLVLRPMDSSAMDWSMTENKVICSAFVLGWMYGSAFKREKVREIRLV